MSTKLSIPPHLPDCLHDKPLVQSNESYRAFEKDTFSYLEKIKVQKGYPKEQMSLVIMDTFKRQDSDEMRKFCAKNSCEIVIIPHNLTHRFEPLDISVNKATKSFISDKCNSWLVNEVPK